MEFNKKFQTSSLQIDLGLLEQRKWLLTFIPANRAISPFLPRDYFSSENYNFTTISIDYLDSEFGKLYKKYIKELQIDFPKNNPLNHICETILKGHLEKTADDDLLIVSQSANGVLKTRVKDSSSGQQAIVPILLALQQKDSMFFIIEEPEAHIYPQSQYELVKYMVAARKKDNLPLLVTTHSPYILTAFNNLSYAGQLETRLQQAGMKKRLKKLNSIYDVSECIPSGALSAYMMQDGEAKDIIDKETGLILAEELDAISDIISDKYYDLVYLETENE